MNNLNGQYSNNEPLGHCYVTGPCDTMRQQIVNGTVYHDGHDLRLCNTWLILGCPWCGGHISPALLATWPHDILHPPKAAA